MDLAHFVRTFLLYEKILFIRLDLYSDWLQSDKNKVTKISVFPARFFESHMVISYSTGIEREFREKTFTHLSSLHASVQLFHK